MLSLLFGPEHGTTLRLDDFQLTLFVTLTCIFAKLDVAEDAATSLRDGNVTTCGDDLLQNEQHTKWNSASRIIMFSSRKKPPIAANFHPEEPTSCRDTSGSQRDSPIEQAIPHLHPNLNP